jgi:cytochrome P450
MSVLAARRADGEDRQDLLANCIFFVLAGHQTTTNLLTLGTHLLCTYPEVLAALREDPGRWPAAVEEMLRLITPTLPPLASSTRRPCSPKSRKSISQTRLRSCSGKLMLWKA